MSVKKKKRGFAALSKEDRIAIASLGGRAQGKHVNPTNFANNPKRARLAGKKSWEVRSKKKKKKAAR